MTEHASVVRITTLSTDDERWDDLVATLQRYAAEERQWAGCFGAQVCSVGSRPDTVAIVSRWRSRTDMDAFLGEHLAQISRELNGLITEGPDSVLYTSLRPS